MSNLITGEPRFVDALGRYMLQVRYHGKRKSVYSKNKNPAVAKAECRKKAAEWLDEQKRLSDADIDFETAWNLFFENYKRKNSISTVESVKSHYRNHLKNRFKNYKLKDIRKFDWQNVIYDGFDAGKINSSGTMKNVTTTIRTFCKWCAANGFMPDADVPLYFDFPAGTKKRKIKILQPDQLKILFSPDAENNFYIYCFRFIVLTGLRRGEFCALQKKRDFDGEKITVRQSITGYGNFSDGKTANAHRVQYLPRHALRQIFAHTAQAPASRFLFGNPKGGHIVPQTLYDNLKKWGKPYGIDVSVHELRHTYISYSRQKTNIELNELKKIYGHSEAMNTDGVYVHPIEKSRAEIEHLRSVGLARAAAINDAFDDVISGVS